MSDIKHLFILKQIEKGVYQLSPRRKGRSLIWSILSEIIKEDGEPFENYLYCRTCNDVLKYSPKQSSNLSRHKCCQSLKECLKSVTNEDKEAAVEACVAWLTEDCQPFSAVNGTGFAKLVKFFISIGAKHGEYVDIEDLLPTTQALTRQTETLAAAKKMEIKSEIDEAIENGGATAAIHMWKDNYVRRHFLGVTLHYEKELKLREIVLGMKSLDAQRLTSAGILHKLSSLFSDFGISSLANVKFITDNEATLVEALSNNNNIRFNCNSQLFASVLEKSFKETAELTEMLDVCKKILKNVKCTKKTSASQRRQLQTSLKNECPTYWDSNFSVLKFIADNMYEFNLYLETEDKSFNLNYALVLQQIGELCNDFEIIFKKLQVCSSPSLCFVIPSIQKIKRLCAPKPLDAPATVSLKAKIIQNVHSIWWANISLWERAAFFLYPPTLNMQPTDLSDIKQFCITQIDKTIATTTVLFASPPSNSSPPSDLCDKNIKIEIEFSEYGFGDSEAELSNHSVTNDVSFFFPDLLKKPKTSSAKTPSAEIERYCNAIVEITEDFDVLKWWKSNEKTYPSLSKFALQLHSIPASKAAAERSFSLAGRVISEKRNFVWPKSLSSQLFLHSYYQHCKN